MQLTVGKTLYRALALMLVASLASPVAGGAGVASTPASPDDQSAPPILITSPLPDPQQAGVQWFAPTGHTLRGAFLSYWNRYGGLAQFGYPITEEFVEPVGVTGVGNKPVTVQYFERNRFEHHPENAGTEYEVLLGLLGRDLHPPEPSAVPLPSPGRYFEQTGHNLSGAFLSYWNTHGSLFVHGYPIAEPVQETNPIDHKTYLVQYFERSRFELHPENAGSPYEVLLGMLGTQLARQKGYPYGWYPPFGHAADFSWIAGHMGYYMTPMCTSLACGCAIFQYERELIVQLDMDMAVKQLSRTVFRKIIDKVPAVMFGRPARTDEEYRYCDVYPDAGGYFVDSIQTNPQQ